jgi:hypothetical protein
MDIYLAGTPTVVTVPLKDRSGNDLSVEGVEYRVVNHAGVELVARTTLTTFGGSAEAVIEIPASVNVIAGVPQSISANQIDLFNVREARTIELFLSIGGNTVMLPYSYALEPADPLVVGINSFQTLPQAEMIALDMPSTDGWANASGVDKVAALVDARIRICMLNFSLLNSNISWGQESLNYVPEGSFQSPYAGGGRLFMFNGNLSLLTPSQYAMLPARFKAALCKAQLAEADSALGGDTLDARRRDGLLLESIGEVKQMFRAGKPIEMPVSKRALRYLSQFVSLSKRVGRS